MYINPQYLHKEKAKKNIYMALTIIFKNGFHFLEQKNQKICSIIKNCFFFYY